MDSQYLPSNRSRTTASYQTDINALVSMFLSRAQDLNKKVASETTTGSSIINALIRFVIGPGLEPKASPEMSRLGWTAEQRSRFVSQAESFFRMYAGSKAIDFYGREDFNSLQSIAMRNIFNGDVLVHQMYGTEGQGYRPMLQLLSGRWVCNEMGVEDTKRVTGGVVFDDAGREVGYQIMQTDCNRLDTYTVKKVDKYNPAGFEEFRLVLIQPREANQVRGIPWLAPVLQDILDLEKFKIAHRTKAATQALFSAAITSEADAPVQQVSSIDRIRSLEMRGGQQEGPLKGEPQNDVQLGAGNVLSLNPGEHLEMVESKSPMSSYKEFTELELSQIGGAVSVPYEMMVQRYNSNFSSSRATIMGAEKTYKVIREEFASKICAPVWEQVIDWGIRLGEIEAPGYLEGSDFFRRAVLACSWIGPAAIVLDPTREINAHIQAIQNNLEPREVATRELLQMDFEEVADMLAHEKETLEDKGLQSAVVNTFNQKAVQQEDGTDGKEGKEDTEDGPNEE